MEGPTIRPDTNAQLDSKDLSGPPAFTDYSSRVPFLLLPLKLQTKFKRTSDAEIEEAATLKVQRYPRELLIRIYPDQLSIGRHEAQLTESELVAAHQYWRQALQADDREPGSPHSLLAWQLLLAKYGAARSFYLLQQTTPDGLAELIQLRDQGEPLPELTFPTVKPAASSWSQAARAYLLPDQFVATLYKQHPSLKDVADPYIREQLIDNKKLSATTYPTSVSDTTTEFLYPARQEMSWSVKKNELPVGLDPTAMEDGTADELDDEVGLSGALAWLADFNQAVRAGMGIIVPLSEDEFNAGQKDGFKRLVVLGVRSQREPESNAKDLNDLLAQHFYTDGLALVPQGTPTNNTGGESAGFSSAEQSDAEATFRTLLQGPLFEPLAPDRAVEQADGQRFADALGLKPDLFFHVAHADGADGQEAQWMNQVLWPATFGYYLAERVQPLLANNPQAIAQTQAFFERYVTGRGPVPALRIAEEPYGVLPTTQYSRWQPSKVLGTYGKQQWDLIRRLDTTWTERLNQAATYPKLRLEVPFRPQPPSQQDILTVLGQEATSVEYYHRYSVGPNLMDTLAQGAQNLGKSIWPAIDTGGIRRNNLPARFGNPALAGPPARPAQPNNPLYDEFLEYFDPLGKLGITAGTWPIAFDTNFQVGFRKVVHTYADETKPEPKITGPCIDELALSETNGIQPFPETKPARNYIHWLNSSSFDQIRLEDFSSVYGGAQPPASFTPPTSLLYRLLRQAVLLRYRQAAIELGQAPATAEAEYFNILGADTARWDWLYKKYKGYPLHQYLRAGNEAAGQALVAYFASLKQLADLPTARLERLLAEHLDLGNHRLDAWKIAHVAVRLAEQRLDSPQGSYLGAFGWLEDVYQQDRSEPDKEGVREDPDNLGYIHAPTLNHGVAAAVLRQGYKSRQFDPNPANPASNRMAINLSSERVRRAQMILEGIRTGGSLAALLGKEFEEGLFTATPAGHASFARQIDAFRQKFPFASEKALLGQEAPAATPPTEQAARQVVNGLALAQLPLPTSYPPYGLTLTVAAADQNTFMTAVRTLVSGLQDTLDALGDLTVGESVYQAIIGNVEQAGAMLENVAKGKFPPAPDVVHPSRAGISVTHRVLLHLPDDSVPAADKWGALTPLAEAEPALNRWLAQVLGSPEGIQFPVLLGEAQDPAAPLALNQAQVHPIDLLALLDGEALQAGSALDAQLIYRVWQAEGNVAVTIDYQHEDVDRLREWIPLLQRVRQLLGTARSAGPNDLTGPSQSAPGQVRDEAQAVDTDDAEGRLGNVEGSLQQLQDQLRDIREQLAGPAPAPDTVQQLRDMLYELGRYNFPEARRAAAADLGDAAGTASAVAQALARRLAAAEQAGQEPNVVSRYAERAKALLGGDFRFVLRITLNADPAYAAANDVYVAAQQPAQRDALLRYQADKPFALLEWLQGVAPVRDAMDHLEKVTLLYDLLRDDHSPEELFELTPAQLTTQPNPAGDYWLGLDYPATYNPPGDAVSLVQLLSSSFTPEGAQQALWLDEWVEVIPHKAETTSLAFHYDQPNTEAPQTLLLAVAPTETDDPWQWSELLGAVNETLDLAKKRAVEPDSLAFTHLSMLLPAVVAPVAQDAVTMTLDFRSINQTQQFAEAPLASDQ